MKLEICKNKMCRRGYTREEGMAMIIAMIFVVIAIALAGSLSVQIINQQLQQDRYSDYRDAFWGLVAAVQESKGLLESGGSGLVGVVDWTPQYGTDNMPILPTFDSPGVTPLTLQSDPSVEYFAVVIRWENDNIDNNGNGMIDDADEEGRHTIYAFARKNGVVRRVEVVTAGTDVNVWRNAIFAGDGQTGNVVKGNAAIYGSVHILGNHLLPGNLAIAALDLSGTALVHNNYVGVPTNLQQRVPPLPRVWFDGENVETLRAKLRVKRGTVGLSGNSEIGEPHVRGNGWKETMDGVYVTDGWSGNQVIPDGGRGIPRNVFSDNGYNEVYDLGNRINFPRLSDPWREPGTGQMVMNPSTGRWYTFEEYFTQVLLADPNNPTDGIYNGNITLNARGSKFYWNATTGTVMNGSLPPSLPPADHDYIWFDPDNDILRINGQIRINGKLTFTGQGNDRTINYSGKAAILATGDVTIDANLITCNNGNKTSVVNSFPVNNAIGIMTARDMYIGTSAQLDIMGAFYAEGIIRVTKQTYIAGTIVASYFDMGTNVPKIFQVPTLADNLPYGMIADYPIWALEQVGWRELGLELASNQ